MLAFPDMSVAPVNVVPLAVTVPAKVALFATILPLELILPEDVILVVIGKFSSISVDLNDAAITLFP